MNGYLKEYIHFIDTRVVMKKGENPLINRNFAP